MNCKQAKLLIIKFGSNDINKEELMSLARHTQYCNGCRKNVVFWEAWKAYNEESAIEEFFETFDEKNIPHKLEELIDKVMKKAASNLKKET